jgi:DNA gyrase subunit A
MGVIFAKPDKNDRIIEVARNSERGLETEEMSEDDLADDAAESQSSAEDDVTLAENTGSHEGSAAEESAPAPESDESSGNAELDEDNTGGNE